MAQAKDALAAANARFSLDRANSIGNLRDSRFANKYRIAAGKTGQAGSMADLISSQGQASAGRAAGTGSAISRGMYSWLDDEKPPQQPPQQPGYDEWGVPNDSMMSDWRRRNGR